MACNQGCDGIRFIGDSLFGDPGVHYARNAAFDTPQR